ncbi:MAG TPA: phosphotransferase [Rhodanobacteraceae bacterium]|nr:phosphotransferase [Rhodanobacteraceae bacterium]
MLLGDQNAWVLRVSWPHKRTTQVEREAAVLAHLRTHPALPAVPSACPTHSGQPYLRTDDGRWLHLFERIDGTTTTAHDSVGPALRALASLHGALAKLPVKETSPVAWLLERHRRVTARPAPPMARTLAVHYANVLERIGACLVASADRILGPAQWLHGDYHPGNLLFNESRVSGIVDFDEVGSGSPTLELAFALFAFSRNVFCEERFEFDPALWVQGLHAYAGAHGHFDTAWLLRHRDDLCSLFCIDQILIHLEAAQRGLWSLTPGIGFHACWHHLQTPCVSSLSNNA